MDGKLIKATPWDEAVFGFRTAEITQYTANALRQAVQSPGHYTIKVDPLESKKLLHEFGFYYCDTLIRPYCTASKLRRVVSAEATVTKKSLAWSNVLAICHGAFEHGRFHRDFNLERNLADIRYDNWLAELHMQHHLYGLFWRDELAGFIAHSENELVLHAVAKKQRGKGLAKYWWSAVSAELLDAGFEEVTSSISASNVAALNLYASLGFSFRSPVDVYHRLVI